MNPGITQIVLIAVVFVCFSKLWFIARQLKQKDEASKKYSTLEKQVSEFLELSGLLQKKFDQAVQDSSRFQRLADTHMRATSDFEKERNKAWDLYNSSAIQAGNAQVWIMREFQAALLELNRYRSKEGLKDATVSVELQSAVEGFASEHLQQQQGGAEA